MKETVFICTKVTGSDHTGQISLPQLYDPIVSVTNQGIIWRQHMHTDQVSIYIWNSAQVATIKTSH